MGTLKSTHGRAAVAWASLVIAGAGSGARCQQTPVTVQVEIKRGPAGKQAKAPEAQDVVVWLKALDGNGKPVRDDSAGIKNQQIVQKNKSFHPHLTVVRVGTMIDFPNRDPFFHNVFSLFDGKRFDLGLYEAGATNSVRFDRLGVSFLFCNIHPEMSAVVVAVDTPYYGVTDRSGTVTLANVPDGRYELHFWYERSLPEDVKALTRTVALSSEHRQLGPFAIPENPSFTTSHKNKYGQDYAPPPASGYSHP